MKKLLPLTLLSALALACAAGTEVTNSWTAPGGWVGAPPSKTLVVARVPDETTRRQLERDLAAALRSEGVDAVASIEHPALDGDVDPEAIREVVREEDFDAVLVSQFEGIETETEYAPGFGYGPFTGYPDPFVTEPGYVYTEREAVMETLLFEMEDEGKLVWSARSETLNPTESAKQTQVLAQKLVERMEKDGLV